MYIPESCRCTGIGHGGDQSAYSECFQYFSLTNIDRSAQQLTQSGSESGRYDGRNAFEAIASI